MTIHSEHPFADPDPDPARRLRGRLGGAVTLWTAGTSGGVERERAGLTVSSLVVGGGEPGRVCALLDPASDLCELLQSSGRAVVHLLQWRHRELAEAFAGQLPAPGGPFRMATWEQVEHGPRLADAGTWAGVELEAVHEVGWSDLVVARIVTTAVGDDDLDPLEHRRGRWVRPGR